MTRETQVDIFMTHYAPALQRRAEAGEYAWFPSLPVVVVAERMRNALVTGSYNHDGNALSDARKALGLKHTRKAMEEFFSR
jgi:hypothetical protein